MTGVPGVMPGLEDAVVHGGKMHHQNEKRLGRYLDKRKFACAIARSTPDNIRKENPPLLMFELEWQYCITCNMPHWTLGEEIMFDQEPGFNPNEYWTWQLEEMGFFDKAQDANGPND